MHHGPQNTVFAMSCLTTEVEIFTPNCIQFIDDFVKNLNSNSYFSDFHEAYETISEPVFKIKYIMVTLKLRLFFSV